MQAETKKEIIQSLMESDVLVTEDILDRLDNLPEITPDVKNKIVRDSSILFDESFYDNLRKKRTFEWNITELPTKKEEDVVPEEKKEEKKELEDGNVEILYNFTDSSRKREVRDFITLFKKRYYGILNILRSRKELENIVSI